MELIREPELQDIDAVQPFSEGDQACFDEIRSVLEKHGKLSRFGLTLLHKHFEVARDEVLMETCDPRTRTLTIKPARIEQVERHIATNWRLDVSMVAGRCTQVCQVHEDRDSGNRSHARQHQP